MKLSTTSVVCGRGLSVATGALSVEAAEEVLPGAVVTELPVVTVDDGRLSDTAVDGAADVGTAEASDQGDEHAGSRARDATTTPRRAPLRTHRAPDGRTEVMTAARRGRRSEFLLRPTALGVAVLTRAPP
jgi:hypothetical protein